MPDTTSAKRFILRTGEILRNDEFISAANNAYYLVMQSDGILCKYFGSAPAYSRGLLWRTPNQRQAAGNFFAVLENTGTLCIYKGTGPDDKQGLMWRSNYYPAAPGDYFATIEDDGNICIYRGKGPEASEGIVWKSGIELPQPVPGGRQAFLQPGEYMKSGEYMATDYFGFFLILQDDGNLCVYYGSDPKHNLGLVWGALDRPHPKGDYFVILRTDGVLSIYEGKDPGTKGKLIWNAPNKPLQEGDYSVATLSNNGNLLVFNGYGPDDPKGIIWETKINLQPKPKPLGLPKPRHLQLKPGEILLPNDYLRSPNGLFHYILQLDGNLCGYAGADPEHSQGAFWSAMEKGPAFGNYFAIFREDANLCIYKGTGPQDQGELIWSAFGYDGLPSGNHYAAVGDDGYLGIYSDFNPRYGEDFSQVWSSATVYAQPKADPQPVCMGFIMKAESPLRSNEYLTSPNSAFHMIMQNSGNLAVYHGQDPFNEKGLIWENAGMVTATGDYYLFLEDNGTIGVNRGNTWEGTIWRSPNDPQPAGDYFAMVEDTGNICVYRGKGLHDKQQLVWQSNPPVAPKAAFPTDIRLLMQKNPGINLFSLDLFSPAVQEKMRWRKTGLELLLVYQRLCRITENDLTYANMLFESGIQSAQHLVQDAAFAERFAAALLTLPYGDCLEFIRRNNIPKSRRGYTHDIAAFIRRNAVAIVKRSNHLLSSAQSTVGSPRFKKMNEQFTGKEAVNRFESLEGYNDQFGDTGTCGCEHCNSAFGTAAYFMELMKITDSAITRANLFAPGTSLPERRPDLFKTPLGCKGVNMRVPAVQIVNEVLETAISRQMQEDLPGVQADVFYTLALNTYPNLPYQLPLNETRALLNAAGTSLAEIIAAFAPDANDPLSAALEKLQWSAEDLKLVTTAAKGKEIAAHKLNWTEEELEYVLLLLKLQTLDEPAIKAIANLEELAKQLNISVIGLCACWYRSTEDDHEGFARALEITVSDYLLLLKILELSPGTLTLANLQQIVETNSRTKAAGFTIQQLDYVLNFTQEGIIQPYFNQLYSYAGLEKFLSSLQPLLWPTLVSATALKMTTLENNPSEKVYLQLEKYFVPAADSLPLDLSGVKLKDLANELAREKYTDSNSIARKLVDPDVYLKALTDALVDKKFIDKNGLVQKRIADKGKKPVAKELTITIPLEVSTGRPKKETVKVSIPLTAGQVTIVFNTINAAWTEQQQKTVNALAGFFGTQPELVKEIVDGIAEPTGVHGISSLFAQNNYRIDAAIHDHVIIISKWLMIANALQLKPEEVRHILKYPAVYDFDFATGLHLQHLYGFRKMKILINSFGDNDNRLINYLADASAIPFEKPYTLLESLQQITGWNKMYADDLGAMDLFNNNDPYATVKYLFRMHQCLEIARKTQLDIFFLDNLKELNLLPVTTANWKKHKAVAGTVLSALQSGVSEEEWRILHKKINASLLPQKRDALSAFALYKLGSRFLPVNTVEKLNEFLLLDTEVDMAEETSYMQQALETVQRYLQRCRLGAEKNVVIDPAQFNAAWWSWISDQSLWQQQRRVFMYPENYVQPHTRKNKTALFKALEHELTKEPVNAENAEAAFIRYFNELENLSKLHYVDGLNSRVNGQDTLFLFARTQEQPQQYYYISRSGESWSEWKKITVPVPSAYITPAFAFNKLFIFWVELNKSAERDQSSEDRFRDAIVWHANIRYAFCDRSGKWSAAQTLAADQLVNIRSERPLYSPFAEELFNEEHLHWHKVSAIAIDPSSVTIASDNNPEEKIIVQYGPLIDSAGWPEEATVEQDDRFTGVFAAYQKIIVRANELMAGAQKREQKSYVPLLKINVLDAQLKPSLFIDPSESLIFLNSSPDLLSLQFGQDQDPRSRSWKNHVAEAPSGNPYYSSSLQNVFKRTDTYLPRLFNAVSPVDAALIPVKNNPGMFLFTEKGESFLLDAGKYAPFSLSQKLGDLEQLHKITPEAITEFVFIEPDEGQSVFNLLKYTGIIEESGFVNFPVSYDFKLLNDRMTGIGPAIDREIADAEAAFVNLLPDIDVAIERYKNDAEDLKRGYPRMKKVQELKEQMLHECEQVKERYSAISADYERVARRFGSVDFGRRLCMFLGRLSGNAGLQYRDINDPDDRYELRYTVSRISNSLSPLAAAFAEGGIAALLSPEAQEAHTHLFDFKRLQAGKMLDFAKDKSFLKSGDQPDFKGPFALYYKELFFHAPLLIADALHSNGQFNAAQTWYHYIFNPDASAGCWKYLPFRKHGIEALSEQLHSQKMMHLPENDPADPHTLAEMRIDAYEKSVLLRYITNLLAQADSLLAKNTMESRSAARGLFIYVSELMGNRRTKATATEAAEFSYADTVSFYKHSDSTIPQYMQQLENVILCPPEEPVNKRVEMELLPAATTEMPFNNVEAYFRIPENELFAACRRRAEAGLYSTGI